MTVAIFRQALRRRHGWRRVILGCLVLVAVIFPVRVVGEVTEGAGVDLPRFRGALSAFEPTRSNILGLRSLPFKQLPEYRSRWLSGACSESVV
jgi:hypothetical protein